MYNRFHAAQLGIDQVSTFTTCFSATMVRGLVGAESYNRLSRGDGLATSPKPLIQFPASCVSSQPRRYLHVSVARAQFAAGGQGYATGGVGV